MHHIPVFIGPDMEEPSDLSPHPFAHSGIPALSLLNRRGQILAHKSVQETVMFVSGNMEGKDIFRQAFLKDADRLYRRFFNILHPLMDQMKFAFHHHKAKFKKFKFHKLKFSVSLFFPARLIPR
jgi:hypothetical protein